MKGASRLAFIGLGSNLGDRGALLEDAAGRLSSLPGVAFEALSPVYRTSPVGKDVGGEFLNAVARVSASLPPRDLLASLLELEAEMGRARLPQGTTARPIDLDLLAFGDLVLSLPAQGPLPALILPHPRAAERLFVLVPWADLAPAFVVPGTGKTVAELLSSARLNHPEQSISPWTPS